MSNAPLSTALSVKQVAETLAIRQHGVLALIRSGQLRAIDVSLQQGGRPRWRILPEDLDGFLLRRTYQAPAPRCRRQVPRTNVRAYF